MEELESRSVNAGNGSHADAIQSSRVDSLKVSHEIPAQLCASLPLHILLDKCSTTCVSSAYCQSVRGQNFY